MSAFVRRHARKAAALALILSTGAFARLPAPSAAERKQVASRFSFERRTLGDPLAAQSARSVRAVHPALAHFDAWISAVGASVALNDLDDDGLANDSCLVDPRTDRVVIAPVDRPARYEVFALRFPTTLVHAATMAPMGCTPGDLNEDGRIDLIVYFWGRTPLMFLRRPGPLNADAFVASALVDSTERWYTNALARTDLDGDGHPDIVVANYFPDGAAVLDAHGSGRETMQASMSRAHNGGGKHVYLWAGVRAGEPPTPAFRRIDAALPSDTQSTWTLALGAADLNGDLRPELLFASDFGPDLLLRNDSTPGRLAFQLLHGRRTLPTAASKVLGRDSFKGMGVDFADINHDGVPDFFVSNIADELSLEESHLLFLSTGAAGAMNAGFAPYTERSEDLGLSRSGWGWDAKLDDFDNDATLEVIQATGFIRGDVSRWPELHELATANDAVIANPRSWPRFRPGDDLSGHGHNPFFTRFSDGRFYDIAAEIGLAESSISRGLAVADVDGDGRLDFAVANQWQESWFLHNTAPHPGAFVGLRLLRPLDPATPFRVDDGLVAAALHGTPAIGAVARVRLPGGVWLSREVDGGNGHSGKRASDVHFGVGPVSSETPLKVTLSWRDGDGARRSRTLTLTPGWHTVLLGLDNASITGMQR